MNMKESSVLKIARYFRNHFSKFSYSQEGIFSEDITILKSQEIYLQILGVMTHLRSNICLLDQSGALQKSTRNKVLSFSKQKSIIVDAEPANKRQRTAK